MSPQQPSPPSNRDSSYNERGRMIGRKYQVIRELGHGGMGVVYLARNIHTGQEVAIKELISNRSFRESQVLRFKREIRALQQLRHPHVIVVYDAAMTDEEHYYVMEYVNGTDILDFGYNSLKELPQEEQQRKFVVCVSQLCDALAFIHKHGYVHRDLKPENVLVDHNEKVKLMDFGLARKIHGNSNITMEGNILGTVRYMAPEQVQGSNIDQRADLYAVGLILYEFFCKQFPFNHTNQLQVMMDHVRTVPPAPKTIEPSVPEMVNSIIMKLLEKDPTNRFSDAQTTRAALEEFLNAASTDEATSTYIDDNPTPTPTGDTSGHFQKSETFGALTLTDSHGAAPTHFYDSSLVGLEQHLHEAEQFVLEKGQSHLPAHIVVQGPRGVGKTLFATTLSKRLQLFEYVCFHVTASDSRDTPLSSLKQVFQELLDSLLHPASRISGRLTENGIGVREFIVEYINPILDDDYIQASGAIDEPLASHIMQRITSLLKELSQKLRICFIIDGISEIDSATSFFLSELLFSSTTGESENHSFITVTVTSTDKEKVTVGKNILDHVNASHHLKEINIQPLSIEQTHSYVNYLLGREVNIPQLVELLHNDTKGIPQDIQRYISTLQRHSIISSKTTSNTFDSEQYHYHKPSEENTSYLESAIEQLLPEDKELLNILSLTESEFHYSLIRTLSTVDEVHFIDQLDRLIVSDIIKESQHSSSSFTFTSDYIQEYLQSQLNTHDKAKLHEALSTFYASTIKEYSPLSLRYQYVYHLTHAKKYKDAFALICEVMSDAVSLAQYNLAADCNKLIETTHFPLSSYTKGAHKENYARLEFARSKTEEAKGNIKNAIDILLKLITSIDDEREKAVLFRRISLLLSDLDEYEEAISYCQKALEKSKALQDNTQLHLSLSSLSYLMSRRGFTEKALEIAQRSFRYFESKELPDQLMFTKLIYGTSLFYSGNYDESCKIFSSSQDALEEQGDKDSLIFSNVYLGRSYLEQGEYTKAKSCFDNALALSQSSGYSKYDSDCISGIAKYWDEKFRLKLACRYHSDAVIAARKTSGISKEAQHSFELARVLFRVGQLEDAYSLFKKSREIFLQLDLQAKALACTNYLNWRGFETQNIVEMWDNLQSAKKDIFTIRSIREEILALGAEGQFLLLLGQYSRAVDSLLQARLKANNSRKHIEYSIYTYYLCKCFIGAKQEDQFNFYYSELLNLKSKYKTPLLTFLSEELQALYHFNRNDLAGAERLYRSCLKQARKAPLLLATEAIAIQLMKISLRMSDEALWESSEKLYLECRAAECVAYIDWQYWALLSRNYKTLGRQKDTAEAIKRAQSLVGEMHRNFPRDLEGGDLLRLVANQMESDCVFLS